MSRDTVLVVTASYDAAADYVVQILADMQVPVFRLNTDLFPAEVVIQFQQSGNTVLDDGTSTVSDKQIKSVWYRRNVDPTLPSYLDSGTRDFCNREARAFLLGIIQSLVSIRWMSRPDLIGMAEKKPYQLAVASRIGFAVPKTLVTNSPKAIQQWKERTMIAKAVSSGYIESPTGNLAMFTSLVQTEDLEELETLKLAPVIFQDYIDKISDIRVTVVDENVFAAEILSQDRESSRIDWRATDTPNLQHREHELPQDIIDLCLLLVNRLGLKFGAIDLALTKDGSYIFFEINPNGEWLWIEDQLSFPISERIATWLRNV